MIRRRWLKQQALAWARRRQGVDVNPLTLHRRRIYILPTRHGVLFAFSLLAMLLASLNYNNNLGLLFTFVLAGVGITALFQCQHNLAGLVVHVSPAAATFAGLDLLYPVVLQHPQRACTAIDGGNVPVTVHAGQYETTHITQKAIHRGRQRMARFSLSTTFPLGLFRAWVWIEVDVATLVWPQPATAAVTANSTGSNGATTGSNQRGDDDFAGLRRWQYGDSIRHVDWHALARNQGLMTKQFTSTAAPPQHFNLDTLRELPLELALSRLTRSILDADARACHYGLTIKGETLGPASGPVHRDRCLTALALHKP